MIEFVYGIKFMRNMTIIKIFDKNILKINNWEGILRWHHRKSLNLAPPTYTTNKHLHMDNSPLKRTWELIEYLFNNKK